MIINDKKNKSGSITLVIFIVMIVFITIMYIIAQNSLFLMKISHERECYEKHYQMAYALLSIAQNEYKDQIKKLIADNIKGNIVLFSLSSFNQNKDYSGIVSVKLKEKEQPIIKASVLKDKKTMITLALHYTLT